MKSQPLETHSKLLEIESRLTKFTYLSKEPLPGAADAIVFQQLKKSQSNIFFNQEIPTKDKYFNFYHWYNTMSQFAYQEMNRWGKDKDSTDDDRLIVESIGVIESLRRQSEKSFEGKTEYLMEIFLKEPVQSTIGLVKNKLLALDSQTLGEEFKVVFRYPLDEPIEEEITNEIRITFGLKPTSCEILKDMISKWSEVVNIHIKKQMKEKRL